MANDEGVWAYLYTNHFGPVKPIDKPWKKTYLEMRKEMKALETPFARLIWGIRYIIIWAITATFNYDR